MRQQALEAAREGGDAELRVVLALKECQLRHVPINHLEEQHEHGETPLMVQCGGLHEAHVLLLLEAHANAAAVSPAGRPVLHLAAEMGLGEGGLTALAKAAGLGQRDSKHCGERHCRWPAEQRR